MVAAKAVGQGVELGAENSTEYDEHCGNPAAFSIFGFEVGIVDAGATSDEPVGATICWNQ